MLEGVLLCAVCIRRDRSYVESRRASLCGKLCWRRARIVRSGFQYLCDLCSSRSYSEKVQYKWGLRGRSIMRMLSMRTDSGLKHQKAYRFALPNFIICILVVVAVVIIIIPITIPIIIILVLGNLTQLFIRQEHKELTLGGAAGQQGVPAQQAMPNA
jgi:hypothetical protein